MHRLRALVVDDEYAARETLCRLVDWSAFGFDPPETAINGMQALERWKAAPFDLVLTDIEMPVMNGIALIEAIREDRPQQSIVIVSCHEKFEYARRALQLGVEDYFIKDLLTEKELIAFLSSFALASSVPPDHAPPRSTLDDALRLAVNGAPLKATDLPAVEVGMMTAFAVIIDDYHTQSMTVDEGTLIARIAAFASETESIAHYYPGGDICYLLFEVDNNPSILYSYTNMIGIANHVRLIAKKHNLRSVSIGVSNHLADLDRLKIACEQAREAAQMRIVSGQGRTILYDTIAFRKSAIDFQHTDYLLKSIEDFSYHANTACLHLIDKLYEVELISSFSDIHYYHYLNARLCALVLTIARAQGKEYQAVLSSVGISMESVNQMENSREMSRFFKTCLLNLFAEDGVQENDNLVNRALRLIEREYVQDISLNYIADKLHTNKSYLSRLFKEKTGESVMNYITQKKISRAKYLLLHTQMKLYEISDSLSIASPQYLSTVFKRYTGYSPNEYKKALLEQGQGNIE